MLERIVREAEELSIKYIFFSGGEPLMRKQDVIRLCEAHRSVSFAAYTNGTLIDEAFADEVARVENLNLSLSMPAEMSSHAPFPIGPTEIYTNQALSRP